ncbi:hypothetical protein CLPU_1c00520 [Gottschalkia purinilytica]|uniref:YtxH-like protein n=1 Tax=Gottschalkia purinilytica TaxID=1503 RepID=A0A0L0WEI0_GOTPU|nr:hypothetical protein [Gottschalkia purinilytica]KNF09887.1 hypothetical protein CLPU_1c00520 [Gottschalkia purinilytica]
MNGRFLSGIITGSIIGATAGMVAVSRMSPRQRKKAMKASKKMMYNVLDNIGIF